MMKMNFSRLLHISALAALLVSPCLTTADDVAPQLAHAPQPWKQPVRRSNFAEIAETLRFWAEKHADKFTLEERGKTKEGKPIFLARITDKAVRDDDKQVALITATHSGAERTGATSVMCFADWLLGNSREAVETRRKQIVLLMPV
ncbi:MAG: hypothetical protein FJ388_21515, partial [Verrucomicrobia bacterium]|nr:hypothetical protein [Verrucomicrobiota bacterium]